jgi:acyl-CoA synthetase (NDP forming)
MDVVQEATLEKPIIAWKAGVTEKGIRAAASHTGSIAGNAIILDTVFKQKGIITARNFDELIDYSVAFTSPVLPPGKRVGFLVGSGGGGVTGTDAAESLGLEVPTLSVRAQGELNDILTGVIPPYSPPVNPVDLVWGGSLKLNITCARIILREVDALVIMLYSVMDSEFAHAMVDLRDEAKKPILIIPAHPAERREGISLLPQYGIPVFVTPERAVRSLAMMINYANNNSLI